MWIAGTYINMKIIQYLLDSRPTHAPYSSSSQLIRIDDLIIFEQRVNLICSPLILCQILLLLFPHFMEGVLENAVIVSIVETCGAFAVFHRAIGGLGIAGVRQALSAFQVRNTLSDPFFPRTGYFASNSITSSFKSGQRNWSTLSVELHLHCHSFLVLGIQ